MDAQNIKRTFRYRVISAAGAETKHAAQMGPSPTLKELHDTVEPHLGGNGMEHVLVLLAGRPADMFVDEIGVLKGLPRNEKATLIYRANWMARHPKCDRETLPWIAGAAVLFYRRVWF